MNGAIGRGSQMLAIAAILLSCSCGDEQGPVEVTLDDPRIGPLLEATNKVDRRALGFSPIDTTRSITLEGPGSDYDAMLHFYGTNITRCIGFVKRKGRFEYSQEQEVRMGPNAYVWDKMDGPVEREQLVIEFPARSETGVPIDKSVIYYMGDDSRWKDRPAISEEEARSILREWAKANRAR